MPLDALQLAPTAYPYTVTVLLEGTAALARQVTIAASDVVVTLGPVYQADQLTAGSAVVSWSEGAVTGGNLPVPPDIADGDEVLILPTGTAAAAYQPPGQGARSFWVAPMDGAEDGLLQVTIDRARGGS
jgi:hypothetical protein